MVDHLDDFLPEADALLQAFRQFLRGGMRQADFTPELFFIFTQTTKFGLTFQADQPQFWASWFASTTLEFRRFVATLTLTALENEKPASSQRETLLRMLGQEMARFQHLIDEVIYDFEEARVTGAAQADVEREAENYLGDLGETIEMVKQALLADYDYSVWWNRIIVQTGPDDHELYDLLEQVLSTHIPASSPRPVTQPVLFSQVKPSTGFVYPIPIQPQVKPLTPPKTGSLSGWDATAARARLTRPTKTDQTLPHLGQTSARADP